MYMLFTFELHLVFSQASEDARKMMGDRKFYDQMLSDACLYAKQKITRDVDVTSLKDYMQVSKCCTKLDFAGL